MSNQTKERQHQRTWLRWTFIVFIVASLVFMSVKTAQFLQEADMVLGRKPLVVNPTLDDLLVNQQKWVPPSDGLLKQTHIHVALRIATALDSLNENESTGRVRRTTIATIMNEHMMTRASYSWIRSSIVTFAIEAPASSQDSANLSQYKMVVPLVQKHKRVFLENLDYEITI